MDTYLGLDFGGTKLLIGEMDGKGNILQKKRYLTGYTNQEEATEGILRSVDDYVKNVGFKGKLKAAGIGIVGISDNEKGLWISINHIITGPPVPLTEMIGKKLGVPCFINNDVRSATTAELLFGEGRKSKNFIYINVGTGLAAGFVCGGNILCGANNNSGEIGHMVVDIQNQMECICGRKGCVENMLSGYGFTRQVNEYHRDDLKLKNQKADVEKLFELAGKGDADAVKITNYAAVTLAAIIMNLVRTTDPDTVILGGGVVNSGWLLKKTERYLEPHTMRGVSGGVMLSGLPQGEVGLMGAASLGVIGMRK